MAAATDIAYLSASELVTLFLRREFSPLQVARTLLDRVECLNPAVNAVVHFDPELTIEMARASEARYRCGRPLSALDGVPTTVKDLCALAGLPFQRGSLALDRNRPVTEDAACVARLREAGVVFLGKTATPEAGGRPVTRSAAHGVTANPYSLAFTPGGSSGGAAAALALGFGPLAVGTDGAGSIRIPACYTNVFGLKPSFGRIPAYPTDIDMPHSVVGPMTRTVRDAATMLEIMSCPDPRDPYMWPAPFVMPDDLSDPDLSRVTVAFSPHLGLEPLLQNAEVDRLVADAKPLLEDANATVVEQSPSWPIDPHEAFDVLTAAVCAASVESFPLEKRRLIDPLLLKIAERGRDIRAPDVYRAIATRMSIAAVSKEFFSRFDLLVGPVMPVPAFPIHLNVPEGVSEDTLQWCPYTYPWNMTGQPAASVPIGFTELGLPIGAQEIGRIGQEDLVLRAAAAIEARNPMHLRRPSVPLK